MTAADDKPNEPLPPLPDDLRDQLLAILFGATAWRESALAELMARAGEHADAIAAHIAQHERLLAAVSDHGYDLALPRYRVLDRLGERGVGPDQPPGQSVPNPGGASPERGPRTGAIFGDYKILELLGTGGMGEVYLAQQQRLDRRVALKVIRSERLAGAEARERFRREARAVANLRHPGVCTVLEVGEVEDMPFLAMQYVEGETLVARLASERAVVAPPTGTGSRPTGPSTQPEIRATLAMVEQVAHALHAAHEAGVVHRDVKPGNIMIDPAGRPVLLDFGLARDVSGDGTDATLTMTGDLLGTPAYMSPEQVRPRGPIDRRTDVYSLGVTLYECLTLQRPFVATNQLALYEQIELDPTPDPRRSNPNLPVDLSAVLGKAMEKSPARRYATAAEFAEELRRVQNRQPVLARRIGWSHRCGRWAQRNPAAAALLIVLAVGLATTGFLLRAAMASEQVARTKTTEAERATARAEAGEESARQELTRAKAIYGLVEDMLTAASPGAVKGKDYTVREALDDFDRGLGARLSGDPEVEASLRRLIGRVYTGLGLYGKAMPHLEAALGLRRQTRGGRDLAVVDCLEDRAQVMLEQSRPADALAELEEARATATDLLGSESVRVAELLMQVSDVRRALGDLPLAEQMAREALATKRRLGADEASIAVSLHNLALVLSAQGRFDECLQTHRDALAMTQGALGAEHPHVAKSLMNLGLALQDSGKLDESEAKLREGLSMQRRLLEPEHRAIADSLTRLGETLRRRGKLQQAEEAQREALTIYLALFGEDHSIIGRTWNCIGMVCADLGRVDEAEAMYRAALALDLRLLDTKDLLISRDRNNLGEVLLRQGKLAECETELLESLRLARLTLAADNALVTSVTYNLARCFKAQGKLDQAEARFREILDVDRKRYGPQHPYVGFTLGNLAGVLQQQGKLAEAEDLERQAHAILVAALGDLHRESKIVLFNLVGVLEKQDKFADAEALLTGLLTSLRVSPTAEPTDIAGVLARIATMQLRQGKHAEALPILRECLEIRSAKLPGDWLTYNTMSMLGGALAGTGQHDEAEPLLHEGYEKMTPPPPAAYRKREALERLIQHYESWGKPEEAARCRSLLDGGQGR